MTRRYDLGGWLIPGMVLSGPPEGYVYIEPRVIELIRRWESRDKARDTC